MEPLGDKTGRGNSEILLLSFALARSWLLPFFLYCPHLLVSSMGGDGVWGLVLKLVNTFLPKGGNDLKGK